MMREESDSGSVPLSVGEGYRDTTSLEGSEIVITELRFWRAKPE